MPKAEEIASDVLKIRWLVGVLILLFGIPFVAQQSLWPLLRMGMFAERYKQNNATARYALELDNQTIDSRALGMSPSQFTLYVQRVALNNHQPELLLKKCAHALNTRRVVISPIKLPSNLANADTIRLVETSSGRKVIYAISLKNLILVQQP